MLPPCVEKRNRNIIWKRLVIVAQTPTNFTKSWMNSYTADVILCSYDSKKDMANLFSAFFLDKIDQIRADLDAIQVLSPLNNSNDNNTLPPESLFDFVSVNDEIVSKIIRNSLVKSCSLDPLPTYQLTHVLKHMKHLVNFKLLILLISRLLQGPSNLHINVNC